MAVVKYINNYIIYNIYIYIYILYIYIYIYIYISLSTIVLNSRDRQGMYGMQHFCMPRNAPYNRL